MGTVSKPIIIALILLFVLLQYELWFSKGGLRTMLTREHNIAKLQQQNNKLALRNKSVQADIKDLRTGNQAIEERARNELGMVKHGEQFYQIVNKNPQHDN